MAYKNIEDQRRASREHYYKNKQYYLDRNIRRRRELAKFVASFKKRCELCGIDHPAVLEYHHADGNKREILVSEVANRSWGKERILLEVAKCRILCANCHRIEHYNAGWPSGKAPRSERGNS